MADFNCFLIDLKASEQDDLDNLRKICTSLFNENHFCDVILSCKDGQIQAHRVSLILIFDCDDLLLFDGSMAFIFR